MNDPSPVGLPAAPKKTRRSRERRALIVVNLALLGVAAIVAAPASVKAVVSGVQEERECARARALFGGHDIPSLDSDLDIENDASFAAIAKVAQAVDDAHFEALHLQTFVTTCHELADAREELQADEKRVAAAAMSDDVQARDAADRDSSDEGALRLTVLRSHAKLQQQLAGIRLYCDAPAEPRAGDKP
jgi:hypothetical protein